jgi:catechol 2,3-dioxygenase
MSQSLRIRFSHVGLFVTDLARMEDFYSRFLGLTVTDRGPLGEHGLVFLSGDPAEHHQIVLVSGRPAGLPFNVINQLSFRVPDLGALRAFHSALQHESVTDIAPVTHGNALSLYFRDPEGNRIELYMDTPWYVEQPMRIGLDLSLSDEALWAWIEERVRVLPGFRPAEDWRAEIRRRMAAELAGPR